MGGENNNKFIFGENNLRNVNNHVSAEIRNSGNILQSHIMSANCNLHFTYVNREISE